MTSGAIEAAALALSAGAEDAAEEIEARDDYYQNLMVSLTAIGALSLYGIRKYPKLTASVALASSISAFVAKELSVVLGAEAKEDQVSLLEKTFVLKRLPIYLQKRWELPSLPE